MDEAMEIRNAIYVEIKFALKCIKENTIKTILLINIPPAGGFQLTIVKDFDLYQ